MNRRCHNTISLDITGDELTELLNMRIEPCPACNGEEIPLENAQWLYGETIVDEDNWYETIAFGCWRCQSSGPADFSRAQAIQGWNQLVG